MINTNIHKVLAVRARYVAPDVGRPTVSLELMTDGGDAAIHLNPSEAMAFARIVRWALEQALDNRSTSEYMSLSLDKEMVGS